MIFTRLELKNFKSHANTVLDFNPGISLIVGENGAGKSSLFEAISYALFKVSTAKTMNDLVRSNKNSGEKIEMVVKLSFISKGIEYKVERITSFTKSSNKSSSNLFILKDGQEEILASGNKQVDNEIEMILGMNSSTFLNAIHIRQGEIATLVDETPGNKKELIAKLLKLEELQTAYTNFPRISKEYETREAVLKDRIIPESELNFNLKKAKEEYFALDKKISLSKEAINGLEKEIEVKSKEKEESDKQKSDFETLKLNFIHERENLKGLNKSKDDLAEKLDEILRNEKEVNILRPYSEKLPIYKEFKDSLIIFNQLKSDELNNKEILKKIEGYKAVLEEEKENHEKFINLDGEIKSLNTKKAELSSELKQLSDLESQRNTLIKDINKYNQDLDIFYNDSKEILSKFDLDDEIKSISTNDDLNKLDSIVENLRTGLKGKIEEIDEEINGLKKEAIGLKQEIKSLEEPLSDIQKVENKCPTCQSEISEDKKNELINMYETTISNNSKRIVEINELLTNLNKDKLLKDAKLSELDSIKTNIYQNKHIVGDLDKFNKSLEALDIKINELQSKKEELQTLEENIEIKNNDFKELEVHNNRYLEAQTLLKSTPEESKIKDQLYTISGNIKIEDEKLKNLISLESQLSLDIDEDDLNASIKDLSNKDNRYQFLLGSVKDKADYEEKLKAKTGETEVKTNEIEEIKKNIENSPFDEENHQKLTILLDRLSNKFNESSQELAVDENNLGICEKTINDIENLMEENRKNKEEYIAVKEYLKLLNELRDLYHKDGIQKELRSQSKPLIQKYTREFFEKFNFNYSDLILDDDFNISIFGPEGEANMDMVSGGEKIAIALALRLAITQAMSKGNIETILLDEPTIHLDITRRQELIQVLRSMSVIPQMIIVTHDSELENAADTLIRVEKEDGISSVEINV